MQQLRWEEFKLANWHDSTPIPPPPDSNLVQREEVAAFKLMQSAGRPGVNSDLLR